MKKLIFIPFLISGSLIAQSPHCYSSEYVERMIASDPQYALDMKHAEEAVERLIESHENARANSDDLLVIPVVFHVVYNIASENLSDEQIQSQLDVLNKDFRRLNADASSVPSDFEGVAADCNIQFSFANVDPDGNPTNGITRTETVIEQWNLFASDTAANLSEKVKETATGGHDIWDRDCYLNIWVCDLGSSILGYASPPGTIASKDGVVIGYKWLGSGGSAIPPYNKGRTTTHEVGHWLGLKHIWGDDGTSCGGSDAIADTPNQSNENYGCPSFPLTDACSPTVPGVMFMNYMDYTDDACMFMFTEGQSNKMRSVLEGTRNSLLSCGNINGINPTTNAMYDWQIYPNPASSELHIEGKSIGLGTQIAELLDGSGRVVWRQEIQGSVQVSVSSLPAGPYVIRIISDNQVSVQKILIAH